MLQNPSTKYRPFAPVRLQDRRWPDAVITQAPIWCSVDLRDGNQALIEPMDIDRKMRMFEQLVKIGFKEIEVGFPSASQVEFDFMRKLIEENRIPDDVTIQVLTQAREHLIRRTFEALEGVPRAIVHLYNATAPVMRRVVLNMSEDEIVELATSNARMFNEIAANYPQTQWTFQYSPEMYSDTELEFSRRVIDAVTDVWQPTPERKCIINLPTTVEHSTPNIFADMVEWTHRHIQRRDSIVLSVHPHNDRGTGTATAELALMAGADRLEGCLFGNGERTGNLDVVNVALNMYIQGVSPGLDFSDIDGIRSTVEHCNQLPVHPRHPYVGDLVYTSFSGSHQDAIKKAFADRKDGDIWDMPYLPIDPKDLGRSYEAVIRVNSQSGKGGIAFLLQRDHGVAMPRRMQVEFSAVVQRQADASEAELASDDLWALFEATYLAPRNLPWRYGSHHLFDSAKGQGIALEVTRADGLRLQLYGEGSGPIDAMAAALGQHLGLALRIDHYEERSLGQGAGATALAIVEAALPGVAGTRFGAGSHANIVTASILAVLHAAGRLVAAQPESRRVPAEA
jgi:2-isopropylmalate synthase